MHILGAILIGLVVGLVARFLLPGKDPGGCLATTAVGIAGALVAKFIGEQLGFYSPGQAVGFIASVAGAVFLLLLLRLLRPKKTPEN